METMDQKHPAVVLDLSPNGIGICRSLTKKNIKIYAYDTKQRYKIGKTRYASCGICPDPIKEEEDLLAFLINIGEEFDRKAVLYTCSDDYLKFLSSQRERLSDYYLFSIPDQTMIESVLDKRLTHRLAMEYNIPSPKTFFLEHTDQLEEAIENVTFPCILKPAFSADYRKRMNKKAIIIHNENQLREKYNYYEQFGEIMIQEFIPGDENCGYELGVFIDDDFKVKAAMTVQKLSQFPPVFGTGTLLISKRDESVISAGVSLLNSLKFKGLANVEFKKDPRDQQLKFIEINARPWLWHSLSEPCGIDFAFLYYLSLTSNHVPTKEGQKENIKWLFLVRDFLAYMKKRKKGVFTIKDWLQSISGEKVFALFSWKDIMPFIRKSIADIKAIRK